MIIDDALKLSKGIAKTLSYADVQAILKASCNVVSDYGLTVLTLAFYESFKDTYMDDEKEN